MRQWWLPWDLAGHERQVDNGSNLRCALPSTQTKGSSNQLVTTDDSKCQERSTSVCHLRPRRWLKHTNRHALLKIQVDFEHIEGFHGLLPTFVFGLKTPIFSHRIQCVIHENCKYRTGRSLQSPACLLWLLLWLATGVLLRLIAQDRGVFAFGIEAGRR